MTFQSRVENWQRWARGHAGLRPLQAESLERLYRSLNWGDIATDPNPGPLDALRGPVDILDAQIIEDAWRTLPEPYRTFLKSAWIRGHHPRVTCRKAGVHHLRYEEILVLSMHVLAAKVRVTFGDYDGSDSSKSTKAAELA